MLFDVFNGDADGIFALHQYRLDSPSSVATLITGVKRDIRLLQKIGNVKGAEISVFDVSLASNRESLLELLDKGCTVNYFDHHFAGEIPEHPNLRTQLDSSPEVCTSLLVNQFINSAHPLWAICGAFGDNLHSAALALAKKTGISEQQTQQLRELGELFNYNGYGATLDDLHYHPAELYRAVQAFRSPFSFLEEAPHLAILREGYRVDLDKASEVDELSGGGKNRLYLFPDAPWSRRISGVFSNIKARKKPEAAHAVLSINNDGSYRVSVRAPLAEKRDADLLCNAFPTGGGRAGAAGINQLPTDQLENFIAAFARIYS
jgi:hypothetical protein